MASNPRRRNGHRRDELIRRVRASEDHCGICGGQVDKTLRFLAGSHGPKCKRPNCPGCTPHPLGPTVDEIVPVSRGGDPLARSNVRLAHRICNQRRGNGMTKRTPRGATPGDFPTTRRW